MTVGPNAVGLLQYALFLAIVVILVKPVGRYLHRVFEADATMLDPLLRPVERLVYRLAGVDPRRGMDWKQYTGAFLTFSLGGTLLLYLILRAQPFFHAFDPAFRPGPVAPDLAMNTAISFATTTTWQAYGGETTLSYFSQIVGLAVQNFAAGAAGLAVGVAFVRGLAREQTDDLGNFWVDLVRAVLWVLLPITAVGTLVLVWEGVPLNFHPYQIVPLHQAAVDANGKVVATQLLPMGPVAALEFIKNLGTNGGGFFNVNGAHPFANPTPLTNFVAMLAIVVLPAGFTHTFGRMVGRPRQGWVMFWVMVLLFVGGLLVGDWAERQGHPRLALLGIDARPSAFQPGGNMEGKETRFGISGSVLTAVTTSNGATGSYNAMHDSFMPLGGALTLANMLLGEIVFGGLGTGLSGMVVVALVAVFVAGLMVGRTPEYLGKHITAAEMKLVGLYILASPLAILGLTGLAVVSSAGTSALTTNSGPHGFSEILLAYTSSFANNGQNFAGLDANRPFYNVTTALAMVVGRFGLAVPALALAGRVAQQRCRPIGEGTVPTDTPLFAFLLLGTALIVGALSYLPALALGPIVEHLQLAVLQ
jgi:potassium-transporting ATPase potassium-binding subunit